MSLSVKSIISLPHGCAGAAGGNQGGSSVDIFVADAPFLFFVLFDPRTAATITVSAGGGTDPAAAQPDRCRLWPFTLDPLEALLLLPRCSDPCTSRRVVALAVSASTVVAAADCTEAAAAAAKVASAAAADTRDLREGSGTLAGPLAGKGALPGGGGLTGSDALAGSRAPASSSAFTGSAAFAGGAVPASSAVLTGNIVAEAGLPFLGLPLPFFALVSSISDPRGAETSCSTRFDKMRSFMTCCAGIDSGFVTTAVAVVVAAFVAASSARLARFPTSVRATAVCFWSTECRAASR